MPSAGGLAWRTAAARCQEAIETALFAPVCARFAKGGTVVPPGRGPRNVGPLGRNAGVLSHFQLPCGVGGFRRQMSADVLI